MPATTRSGMMFDLGTVVHTAYDDAGWIGVRVDGFGEEESGLGDSELQTQFGFTSRPVDRDANGGCETLYSHSGNSESFAYLGKDARYIAKCPPLTQGSSVHWNSSGAFHLLDATEETSTLYIPVGGKAHTITVGKDSNGSSTIDLLHTSGASITITDTDIVIRHTGNGFIRVQGDDVTVNGALKASSGLDVGGGAGQPVINATLLVAALNSIASSISSGGSAPVVATALGAAIASISAAVTGSKTQFLTAL
jgi:hypothetical protein